MSEQGNPRGAARALGVALWSSNLLWLVGALGCNALDEPGVKGNNKRIVPTDSRPVQQALRTPPPISGGTVAVSSGMAVAADPARDRVSLYEFESGELRTVELEEGDQPGRVAIDDQGFAHVVLRGSGEVLRLRLADGEVMSRRAVCRAPRGLAYEAPTQSLHVACAEGKLVTLPAAGGEATLEQSLADDLRDVVVMPDGSLAVSRFKSARLLAVARVEGQSQLSAEPPTLEEIALVSVPDVGTRQETRTMRPHLAWRITTASPRSAGGSTQVVMLHQRSREEEINIDIPAQERLDGGSSYGGGSEGAPSCEGVVQTGITMFDAAMGAATVKVAGAVLPVDIAVSSLDGWTAIAQAGTADPDAPEPFVLHDDSGDFGVAVAPNAFSPGGDTRSAEVLLTQLPQGPAVASDESLPDSPCVFSQAVQVDGQATAVAFTDGGDLVVQSREPARLFILRRDLLARGGPFPGELAGPDGISGLETIELGGDSVADTGHDLFHRNSGDGIACASCHAEGGDDGHTWNFSGIGRRRTQAVHVGLEGTAPFHWDGDMHDLNELMTEVFVGRMGGVHQSASRLGALSDWLFSLKPPPSMVDPEDPAAERGRRIFESADVGCASCHAGSKLTHSDSFDVGTTEDGHPLQVPSLRGVAYRAPFIHTGCAETLRDRFDPACGGGDMHGHTSDLSDAEVDDLIAYLKSL